MHLYCLSTYVSIYIIWVFSHGEKDFILCLVSTWKPGDPLPRFSRLPGPLCHVRYAAPSLHGVNRAPPRIWDCQFVTWCMAGWGEGGGGGMGGVPPCLLTHGNTGWSGGCSERSSSEPARRAGRQTTSPPQPRPCAIKHLSNAIRPVGSCVHPPSHWAWRRPHKSGWRSWKVPGSDPGQPRRVERRNLIYFDRAHRAS